MATITKGKTFTNGETVTPQKLHELVDLGTVSGIVNADISASAAIADTKLAQITTAGKVANTATTATSANTANAIVVRDAGGSFTAGTITAALSGNAATATTAAACSGNAATATTLQTARTINGVSFNGSGNITVTAAPNAHTHAISDTTGLQTALDGKQANLGFTPVQQGGGAGQLGNSLKIGWSSNNLLLEVDTTNFGNTWPINISGTANPVAHTHDDRYYTETEMNALLAGKQASGSYAPATGIAQSAVTNLTTDLAGKAASSHTHDDRYYTETEMNTLLAGKQASGSYAAAAHFHNASDINAGTLSNSRTTATNLRFADYVASTNSLNVTGYAGAFAGKIPLYDATYGTLDTYLIKTFGVSSYSSGPSGGVYSVYAVSKPGVTLVENYIGGILSNSTNTGVIFTTSSDYRLKTNLERLTGALDRLAALPVHRFNWIGHMSSPKVDGFLAHEAQAVVPECVTGTKDEVDAEGKPIHQGIDQSKLVPLLVAAVQELSARVAALEAR